jgi:hypothetical protein
MGKLSSAEVLRLHATSAVSRDQFVRRSAQDDDSVGVLTENILDKLALYGSMSWVILSRPCGTDFVSGVLTQTLQAATFRKTYPRALVSGSFVRGGL